MENNIDFFDSFESFIKAHKDNVFRIWKYKRMFTPYEIDNKFVDESLFEDDYCSYIVIKQVINLGNDYLIGYAEIFGEETEEEIERHLSGSQIEYVKLSEIQLKYYSEDAILLTPSEFD